jgi:hypothetical protein
LIAQPHRVVGEMQMRSAKICVTFSFAAALLAAIPIAPRLTPSGLELSVDRAQATTYRYHRRVYRKVYPRAYVRPYPLMILPTIYTRPLFY